MTSRIIRPLAVAALALSATALSGGIASADATTATPVSGSVDVSGSVEVCLPIPVGQIELSICL
ncbi:hypothetical protein IU459_25775 [Nocardia amamiensis]|uniref:Uncharacterized protein n=1 Tax=Nocardia amamiensis TaxID=404578 RepID=A0ABS0D1C3_9NOCA|nr:hypothetical protein [Nocardia amamiensis]MBF6300929.1 hypothetical protein [Nocardia amamiensis]